MTARVFKLIEELRQEGLSVLLVEQRARQTLEIAIVPMCWRVAVPSRRQGGRDRTRSVLAEAFLGGHART